MARRRHGRFALELADDSNDSRLEDLSLGGMKVLSNRVFKLDQIFQTKIRGLDGPIRVRARIVRGRIARRQGFRYEYGAALATLSGDDHEQLTRFIEHLSESGKVIPEDPGQEDLQELQQRIASLQQDLNELEDRHSAAVEKRAEAPAETTEPTISDDQAFSTSFSAVRFEHLLRMGQPLIRTVEEPAAGLVGEHYQLVAQALSDPFDLQSLTKALRGNVMARQIPEALLAFYERRRIDFA